MIDLAKIIADLKQERDQLEAAIGTLERMSGKSQRGRQPPGRGGPPPESNLPPCAGGAAQFAGVAVIRPRHRTRRVPLEPQHSL